MGCNSDHMNPTAKEKYLQETAQLYSYAITTLGKRISREARERLVKAAADSYCEIDYTADLCALMNAHATEIFIETGLINGLMEDRDISQSVSTEAGVKFYENMLTALSLAVWWQKHQMADFEKVRAAKKAKDDRVDVIKKAAKKLSSKERDALGINAEGEKV
jgi:hypothetical protein